MRSDNLKLNDIFWNTLATVTYAAVSLLLSLFVINISGKIEGGIFSFGYSTLAHFAFIIAYFGMRPLHIVDVKYNHSFKEYLLFNMSTTLISLLLGIIYISYLYYIGNYSLIKLILLILLVIHGAIDGFADCFECEFQRINKLNMCGQSLFFRIILFVISLIVTLYITNNLIYAEIVSVIVEIIAFLFLNVVRSRKLFKSASVTRDYKRSILKETLPLFLIVFLDMYIFSATKFSIDVNLNDMYSGFFNLVFIPTNIIYLVMNLFMKPILTPLSTAYYNNKDDYKKLLTKTIMLAICLSIIFILGTLALGKIYLNIINYFTGNIYKDLYDKAVKILIIVIVGGCFYTVTTPLYYSMVIENKQKYLLIAYAIVFIISIFVSKIFVNNLGIYGAAFGFLANMFLLCMAVIISKVLT